MDWSEWVSSFLTAHQHKAIQCHLKLLSCIVVEKVWTMKKWGQLFKIENKAAIQTAMKKTVPFIHKLLFSPNLVICDTAGTIGPRSIFRLCRPLTPCCWNVCSLLVVWLTQSLTGCSHSWPTERSRLPPVVIGHWSADCLQWSVVTGQQIAYSGHWSLVSRLPPVVTGHWSADCLQWSVVSGQQIAYRGHWSLVSRLLTVVTGHWSADCLQWSVVTGQQIAYSGHWSAALHLFFTLLLGRCVLGNEVFGFFSTWILFK